MRIDENNFDILNRVSEITGTDYDIKWFDAENINGYIEEGSLLSMMEDLICEVGRLQEEIEDMNTPSDYNPEIEVPEIHGKGISY